MLLLTGQHRVFFMLGNVQGLLQVVISQPGVPEMEQNHPGVTVVVMVVVVVVVVVVVLHQM